MSGKKQRGKNFSTEEELLLVDLVTNQKHIFQNKKSDAVNWKVKTEAWMKLEQSLQSQTGIHRPWKTLKDKYENIKRKAKMELAAEKRETYRTGGGTFSNGLVSAVSEKILSLVGNSATGLNNQFDNDADNNNIEDDKMQEEFLDEVDNLNNSLIFEEDFPDTQKKIQPTVKQSSSGVKVNSSFNQTVSKELFICKRSKKTLAEEEKIKLLKLQQAFYQCENCRAAEKHEAKMRSMDFKNEILALELKEKKNVIYKCEKICSYIYKTKQLLSKAPILKGTGRHV